MLPPASGTLESESLRVRVWRGVPQAHPAARPEGSRLYRPELDVLRFFAFLAVYLYHVLNTEASGSLMHHRVLSVVLPVTRMTLGFGMCLFFFLSSYLITSLLRLECARTGTVSLRNFYVRRVLRIWPLYIFFLLSVAVLGHWWSESALEPSRLLAFLALCGNWYSIRFGIGTLLASHLWSISVEEQFYVLWPLVLRRLRPGSLQAASAGVCLLSLVATWTLAETGSSSRAIWLNSLSQSIFFGGGALLALRSGLQHRTASPLRAAGGIGGGLLLWFLCGVYTGVSDVGRAPVPGLITLGYVLVALGCALLLWGFLHLPKLLLPEPLIYLGRISYGLYVFHAVALIVLATIGESRPYALLHLPGSRLILGLAGTTVLASLSYHGLERPFLKLKSRFELVESRTV